MHFYSWVIVIMMLLILGVVLQRFWGVRHEANDASETASDASDTQAGLAAQVANSLRGRLQGLRNSLTGAKPENVATQFRNWATFAFADDPEIQGWLSTLADEQIAALAEHLSEFCRDMGFELSWLLEGKVDQNPDLMQELAQIVLLYSRASYRAVSIQEEVEIFRIYHRYMQDPKSRPNREMGEHLFGKLVEQGMSDVTISEHLAASRRMREQQIIETIENAATKQPRKFRSMLKTVLIERTMPETDADPVELNGMPKAPATAD